jgi:hypothetical protein
MAAPMLRYLLVIFCISSFSPLRIKHVITFIGENPADYKCLKRFQFAEHSKFTSFKACATSFIHEESDVGSEVKPTTEKVFLLLVSGHPPYFLNNFMSLLISFRPSCNDISNFIAKFCSPSNDFAFVLNLIDYIVSGNYKPLFCRSDMLDSVSSQQIDDGMQIERAASLPLSTNFRIVDGGSIMEKYMLDGLGLR